MVPARVIIFDCRHVVIDDHQGPVVLEVERKHNFIICQHVLGSCVPSDSRIVVASLLSIRVVQTQKQRPHMGVCNVHGFLLCVCSVVCRITVTVVANDVQPGIDDLVVDPSIISLAVQTAHVLSKQPNAIDVVLDNVVVIAGKKVACDLVAIFILGLRDRVVHVAVFHLSGSVRARG
jgi:hypothetical protein